MSLTIPLEQIRPEHATIVGGKAAVLARIGNEGISVLGGLSISIEAYRRFVAETGLALRIGRELNRKPFKDMRWEELWDAALRIRNMFLTSDMPDDLYAELYAPRPQVRIPSGHPSLGCTSPSSTCAARERSWNT
jgi:pyruvate,water dikinase